jgi:hypothetical protein
LCEDQRKLEAKLASLEERNSEILKTVVDRNLGVSQSTSQPVASEHKPIRQRREPWGAVAARVEREDRSEYWKKHIKQVEKTDSMNDNSIKPAAEGQ